MVRILRLEVWAFLLLALPACGNDARFGGEPKRRDSRLGDENGAPDPSLDQTQADAGNDDSGSAEAGDGGETGGSGSADASDATDAADDGADTDGGDVIDVPETLSLFWHWPCATTPTTATPADPQAMIITGAGDYMLEPNDLALEIGGEACDPGTGPRDVLFVVDVSDSMRDFLNLGNDPVKNGTCGRSDGVNKVLDALGDDARVALVTFDGNAKTVSDGYLTVASFRTLYAKTAVLCESGANTNFTKAFAAAQLQLVKGRANAAKELYFISDGEPNSTDADGHLEAAAIKKTATIATLMLKGDEVYMRDVLASRDAQDQPLHDKVDKAADLSAALALLADVKLESANVRYGALGDEANWKEDALALPTDLTFTVKPWTLKQADWPTGFGFSAMTVDSKGVKVEASGKLLWKP